MKIKNAIIALYEQGLGGPTIAHKLGLHPQTVYYHLKKVEKPNGGRQAKTNKEEIRILYEQGLSCQQIANQVGLKDGGTVYTRLKNMGIKLRSKSDGMRLRGSTKIGHDKEVIDLYKSGLSQKEIAAKYGLATGDTVRTVLNKYNLNEGNNGARNPSWKGGINPLVKTIRSSTEYENFRDKIFAIYKYTSQVSLIKTNIVNLHHIVEFSFIFNNLLDQDNWKSCPHLWNDNNTIVLSQEEHKLVHGNKKLDINFSRYSVKRITRSECELFIARYHYLGTIPKSSMFIYGLFIDHSLVGCCAFGKGTNRYLSQKTGEPTLELTRLCITDWLPHNTTSYFMAKVTKLLKIDAPQIQYLVSFADPNVGHTGGVYRACNWQYTGQCAKDYMYQLPDGSLVHKSKFRCKNGLTEKERAETEGTIKVPRQGKHRFVYKLHK